MNCWKQLRQYVGLVGANVLNVVVNFATVLLLTRIMGQNDFGSYRYALTFFTTVAVFAQFGIPYSASVLLTRSPHETETRRIITLTALVMFAVSLLAAAMLLIVVTAAPLVGLRINPALLAAVPFVYAAIVQVAYIELLKGANKIAAIAAQTCVPALLILAISGILYLGDREPLGFPIMLGIYAGSYTVVHLATLWRFRRSMGAVSVDLMRRLREAVRSIGRHVYLGSLFAVLSGNLLSLVLGHVVGMAQYAVYGLALSMSAPMQMIPSVMGTVLFKQNAEGRRLGQRSTALTVAITAAAVSAYLVMLKFVFPGVFPASYLRASAYTSYLAAAYALFGLGDYFNRFIGAHGHGTYIARGAIAAGLVNVVVSLTSIGSLGIMGVILGVASSATTYLAMMIYFYRRTVRLAGETDTGVTKSAPPLQGSPTSI